MEQIQLRLWSLILMAFDWPSSPAVQSALAPPNEQQWFLSPFLSRWNRLRRFSIRFHIYFLLLAYLYSSIAYRLLFSVVVVSFVSFSFFLHNIIYPRVFFSRLFQLVHHLFSLWIFFRFIFLNGFLFFFLFFFKKCSVTTEKGVSSLVAIYTITRGSPIHIIHLEF